MRKDQDRAPDPVPTGKALKVLAVSCLERFERDLELASPGDERNELLQRALDVLDSIRYGSHTFIQWIQTEARSSQGFDLEHHLAAVLETPTKYSEDLYSQLVREAKFEPPATPLYPLVLEVQRIFRHEQRAAKDAADAGKRASRNVYVHVIEGEDVEMRPRLMGKRGYVYDGTFRDRPTVVQDSSFILFRILRRRTEAAVDLFFDADAIRGNAADHWILSQPSDVALTADQLKLLDTSALHPDAATKNPLVLARIDPGPDRPAVYTNLRKAVDDSIRVRKGFRRGKKAASNGAAVGLGVRNDQRGSLGQYSNYRFDLSCKPQLSHEHHSKERTFIAYPLLVAGTVLPGILAHERLLTRNAGLPPVSFAGTCTTSSAHRGFNSNLHIEPASDAYYTICASYGSDEAPPLGTGSFCLPCADGGRGIAIEGGTGVVTLWTASVYAHTQATPIVPFDSTVPLPAPALDSVPLPAPALDPNPSSSNKRRATESTSDSFGAVPVPREEEDNEDEAARDFERDVSHATRTVAQPRMAAMDRQQSVARLADAEMRKRNFAIAQQQRGSGNYTKKALLYRQAWRQLSSFPGKGHAEGTYWASPVSRASGTCPDDYLGHLVGDSGDDSPHDERDAGLGACVGLATLPIAGGMLTRSQTRRMRALVGL
ncbi:hypothetical protein JCM11491_005333 [Sporobolomyces phaffii]